MIIDVTFTDAAPRQYQHVRAAYVQGNEFLIYFKNDIYLTLTLSMAGIDTIRFTNE